MTIALDHFTDAQARQLHVLSVTGWTLEVTRRDEEHLLLHVIGTDPAGDQVAGTINAAGELYAEPTDAALRPSWIAVGAPAESTTADGRTV